MWSNPGRKLSLLGFAHPVEGSPFQVQGAIGKATLIRGLLRRGPACGFDVVVLHVLEIVHFNIY